MQLADVAASGFFELGLVRAPKGDFLEQTLEGREQAEIGHVKLDGIEAERHQLLFGKPATKHFVVVETLVLRRPMLRGLHEHLDERANVVLRKHQVEALVEHGAEGLQVDAVEIEVRAHFHFGSTELLQEVAGYLELSLANLHLAVLFGTVH